jgi:hypothetical protein
MSTIPDLSGVPEALRVVIEQRANAVRMHTLELDDVQRQMAQLTLRIDRARSLRDNAVTGLNIHLTRAGFEVGQQVEVIGEVFSRGRTTAAYHGAMVPDSEPEETTAADQLADDRAAYADATRVS